MNLNSLILHRGIIYLLSVIVLLTFGLVLITLRRSALILQEKKWAKPFAITFFVLAGIYSLRFIGWFIPSHDGQSDWPLLTKAIAATITFCSGITNYLFFLSAFRLAEPGIDRRKFPASIKALFDRAYGQPTLILLLGGAGLLRLADRWWANLPDAVLSTLALFFMGFVLYQNISHRHDMLMAKIALLSSSVYAVVYFCLLLGMTEFIIHSLLPNETDLPDKARLLTFLISLLLKFGLFLPGYSLMLLLSGPVEKIGRLMREVTRGHKEYLESIVKAICEELHLNNARLYIKQPGLHDNQIAGFAYPPLSNGHQQEPWIAEYKEGTPYDRVMKSGRTDIQNRDGYPYRVIRRIANATVPVFFHNSVIACVYAERGAEKFTEADLSNLERIAIMISPVVQVYREMIALNKISQALTQHQVSVVDYKVQHDIDCITETIHDFVSPLATGVEIEIGFSKYRSTFLAAGEQAADIKAQLVARLNGEGFGDRPRQRWFKEELKIPSSEQVLGKFIFLSENGALRETGVTVGTDATFRSTLSVFTADILLDFIRGYLNQLTDRLGIRLGGLKGTTTDWHNEVENMARAAKLPWVVASNSSDHTTLIGNCRMIELVNWLESSGLQEKWEQKDDGLWLFTLEQPEAGTYHVIKRELRGSGATLWFGVARQGFGRELDYVSPWRYFLYHFCDIADSALLRILNTEKQLKRMAEVQSIIIGTLITQSIIHSLGTRSLNLIETSIELNKPPKDQAYREKLIANLKLMQHKIKELSKKLIDTYNRDLHRPCRLDEALNRAIDLVRDSLASSGIEIIKQIPPNLCIDIPFDAAANALAIIIDNAKDAIKEENGNNEQGKGRSAEQRWIRVTVREPENKDKYICDITDSGPGIPYAVRNTLLKEVSKSKKKNSHGVGLLISVELLRAYEGDIVLTAPGPEPNTTFSIHFPKYNILR